MYNRFAEMRRRYLREHRDGIYTGMLLTDKLDDHLKEIGDTAQEMFDQLVEQMKKQYVKKAQRILPYGNPRKKTKFLGQALGVKDVQGGTSNVQ